LKYDIIKYFYIYLLLEPIEDDFGELKQKFEVLSNFRELNILAFNIILGIFIIILF